jgi:hypothetical protein
MNGWCSENFLGVFFWGGGLYFFGIVHVLVSLGHSTEHVNACQYFALCYTMQTFLQAYSEKQLVKADVRTCSKV